ncbi:MAG: 2,3-bisphosphoglycerate-independent phosphoglycerate mutase [Desulfovibrionaceae bacterium]|nr:2,3-bisphosphoglycerate-independent phosphoglycerate mutase [Desulfovibrionaceae bacterium]
MSGRRPLVLLILDGFGLAPPGPGNAVSLARTPVLERVFQTRPHTRLACSGRDVGLPEGFMGNSEVGHMNIGAGRVVYQDMTRIDMAIEADGLASNRVLSELMDRVKAAGGRLHLLGLVSDGGVHSHQRHIYALLDLARARGLSEAFVHVFLDGRDTPPTSGLGYVQALVRRMAERSFGQVATVTGRYFAMDRDRHFERNEPAYLAMVAGRGEPAGDAVEAVARAYEAGQTDEFVRPRVLVGPGGVPLGRIMDNDGVFFFNFRADRARQMCRAFFDPGFAEFKRGRRPVLAGLATMTRYDSTFPLPAAFAPEDVTGTLGEVVSGLGLAQLRIAETEKYAHVTYFFNCGREEPFPGEDRHMAPSPRDVATYDLKPEMSAREVTDRLLSVWRKYDLCVCNLANLDMVGHTGIIPAAVTACEVVDACAGRIAEAVLDAGGRLVLTADHGNAEEMIGPDGGPQTAHSTNPVPLALIAGDSAGFGLVPGRLGDIAPTILDLWGVEPPKVMTGKSLLRRREG